MPSSAKFYKDAVKRKNYLNRNNTRYYNRNLKNCTNNNYAWTDGDIKKILFAPKTDIELSTELHRSIRSIQIKRCRAKKDILKYI